MNPQKLAGQCGKLKCCLNFEVDNYIEAGKKLPPKDVQLQTADGDFFLFKTDILKGEITYSSDKSVPANLVTIPAARAFEIIALNKQGVKPDALSTQSKAAAGKTGFTDMVGQDSLTRFDKSKRKKKKKSKPAADKEKQPEKDKPKQNNQDSKPRQNRQAKEKPAGQQTEQRQKRNADSRPRQPRQKRNNGPRQAEKEKKD